MPEFMLLMKGGDWSRITPERQEEIVGAFIEWSRKLRRENRYVAGDDLGEAGKILEKEGDRFVDRPVTLGADAVGGYFVIKAADYAEAVRVGRECPCFMFGGHLEIRQIVEH
jgi:hypothetical protein